MKTRKTTVWIIYALTLVTGSLALMLAELAGAFTLFTGLMVLLCFLVWQLSIAVSLVHKSHQLSERSEQKVANIGVKRELWYSKNL